LKKTATNKDFNLQASNLLEAYTSAVKESPLEKPNRIKKILDFLLITVSGAKMYNSKAAG